MTSAVSRDDVEDELRRAGIKSPYIRSRLMRVIELYARKFPEPEGDFPPVDFGGMSGYKYYCKECDSRKYLTEFPEYKRHNRRSPVPCTECMSKKKK